MNTHIQSRTFDFEFGSVYNKVTKHEGGKKVMQKHIIDEITGIPYILVDDYYLPWGDLPDDELEQQPIGVWGQRHLRYIKQYKRCFYSELLTSGKLNSYLADIDRQAEEMMSILVRQLAEKEGITDKLKAENQMQWVGRMNSIRNRAMEAINSELLYG